MKTKYVLSLALLGAVVATSGCTVAQSIAPAVRAGVGVVAKGYCGATDPVSKRAFKAKYDAVTFPHEVRINCNVQLSENADGE